MAFALKKTEAILNRDNISLAQYTHARKDIALLLLQQLKLLRFIGVSVSTICLRIFLIDLFIKKMSLPYWKRKCSLVINWRKRGERFLLNWISIDIHISFRIFLIDLFIKKIFSPLLEEKMFLKNS